MTENSREIVSETYSVPRGAMIRKMAFRFATLPMIVLAILIAAAAVAAIADIRWLIVALMLACIVAPMVMAWLYLYYGLRPECFVNILPHKVRIDTKGIRVIILQANEEDGKEEEYKETEYYFEGASLKPFTIGMKAISVPVSRKNKVTGFIILPADPFGGEDRLNDAAGMLSEVISSQNRTQNEINKRS